MVLLWLCDVCDTLAVHYRQSTCDFKSQRESLMSCYIIIAMIVICIVIMLVAESVPNNCTYLTIK